MMDHDLPLAFQTAYADLVDRCSRDAFAAEFGEEGTFTSKVIRARRYWYFQSPTGGDGARKQSYVGVETPELLDRIARHRERRDEKKDRRSMVSALVRSASLPRPIPAVGAVVAALAGAGIFRRNAVLVGTVAYQTYAGLLGVRLPAAAIQTGDVDVAQSRSLSLAIEEPVAPVIEALKAVDPSFRPVPGMRNPVAATSYTASGGLRVDFLTPNSGPDTDAPATLPGLGTEAQQIRFLDFLIAEPEAAVLLHGDGVFVWVPSPQRFAIHKLILSRRRHEGAKIAKDLKQAEGLLTVLLRKRPHDLQSAWREACGRGRKWRQLLGEGLGLVDHEVRDLVLKNVAMPRSMIPGLTLEFSAPASRYTPGRDIVEFLGRAGRASVRCAVSREALEDYFGGGDSAGLNRVFRENRPRLEMMARLKYLHWPVEEPGFVLIRTEDVERLAAGG